MGWAGLDHLSTPLDLLRMKPVCPGTAEAHRGPPGSRWGWTISGFVCVLDLFRAGRGQGLTHHLSHLVRRFRTQLGFKCLFFKLSGTDPHLHLTVSGKTLPQLVHLLGCSRLATAENGLSPGNHFREKPFYSCRVSWANAASMCSRDG